MRRIVSFVCVVLFAVSPASAVNVEAQIEDMIVAADLGSAVTGICVVELATGETLVEINADTPLIPASNMKLITSAASLHLLGPDFVFRTDLQLIEPETAGGMPSLLVIGDGDPGFGDPNLLEDHGLTFDDLLNHWLDQIEATGYTEFDRIVVDDRIFDRQFVHPSWPSDQLNRWYCAQVAGLNFYDNCLDILPIPNRTEGLTALIEIYPEVPFLQVTNRITTGDHDRFQLNRRPGTNELSFFGTVRNTSSSPWNLTIHDPPLLFGQLLQHRLGERGITVGQVARPDESEVILGGETLHRVQTALPLVLNRLNRNSQNLFGEALLKRMGREVTGSAGGWNNGGAAVRRFLTQTLGPHASVVEVADGSGLSRNNRVTPRVLTDLLNLMYTDPERSGVFLQSLASAGKTESGERVAYGTLSNRLHGLEPGVYVYGKTGYIRSVTALSGYLILPPMRQGRPHRVYTFSMLVNGYADNATPGEVKELLDAIVVATQDALLNASPVATP